MNKDNQQMTSLRKTTSSHMMQNKNYASLVHQLGVHKKKNVIAIDPFAKWIQVEPGMRMEELVDITLPLGLIPPVVPEFKGITVGGAINGGALESSSHRYGQFNDQCLSYEILIGDGEVIEASEKAHSDLFYAISGSYGTLGVILSAKIKLIPIQPWVGLTYQRFCKLSEAFSFLTSLASSKEPPSFMEAICFSEEKTVVIFGSYLSEKDTKNYPKKNFSAYSDNWFYSHCDQIQNPIYQEALPLRDYIFRHDRGAFWMGGYGLHPSMTLRYFAHKCYHFFSQDSSQSWMEPRFCLPKNPGAFFRFLFGGLMNSQTLYKSLHNGSESWFQKHFVIQDFYLPENKALIFTESILEEYKITPLWICPIRSVVNGQIFSPHQCTSSELLFDIGIYGIPFDSKGKRATQAMERLAYQLGGKKLFYSMNYIPLEQFWSVYPLDAYQILRKKYGVEDTILDITKKVLEP